MVALVITHTESEDPGLLGTWLPEAGLGLKVVEPWRGDDLPQSLDGFDALVVMGGPQQAYDDGSAPWLRATKELIRSAVANGLPTLGVCLGAQLLAEATGGRVQPGEHGPEVGAKLVAKRDAAAADPLFWDLPLSPVVVQWHWDAVTDLPPAATLLMSSPTYPHQAFRVGERAWGIQFHIETDAAMVGRWADNDRGDLLELEIDPDVVLGRTVTEIPEIEEVWGEVARRFARLALAR
ncbi:MAG: glutamine amidotransferase class-I [Frankiales bacterium]|nr:glutamine amidotransferase class-I [Frankiales bacterium]MCW2708474.1 glutamine amidotransferase class-I [Frankiales bacterium]